MRAALAALVEPGHDAARDLLAPPRGSRTCRCGRWRSRGRCSRGCRRSAPSGGRGRRRHDVIVERVQVEQRLAHVAQDRTRSPPIAACRAPGGSPDRTSARTARAPRPPAADCRRSSFSMRTKSSTRALGSAGEQPHVLLLRQPKGMSARNSAFSTSPGTLPQRRDELSIDAAYPCGTADCPGCGKSTGVVSVMRRATAAACSAV